MLFLFIFAFLRIAWGAKIPRQSTQNPNPRLVQITVPYLPGPESSRANPEFCGFAFEERSFSLYAGPGGQPNVFSQNLINAIASRTGVSPSIRVGGTSLDHSIYNSSQPDAVEYPPGQGDRNVPMNLRFGPPYFQSFDNFPNAQYVFDIPLAKGNLTNSLEFAQAGYQAIGRNRLDQLEVGNEPNSYNLGDRPRTYGAADYVKEWGNYTDAICDRLGFSCHSPIYEAATLASPQIPRLRPTWTVQQLFEAGLSAYVPRIKSVSLHYYQTTSSPTSDLQRDLMNHTAVVIGSAWILQARQYLASNYPNIPLNLAEIGSALNPIVNNYALESVLGAALWQVDFMLYTMANGINRVNYQLGIGFAFALWQPIDYKGMPASVKAPFYGHVFTADFIGRSGNTQVTYLDLQRANLSAYAAYEYGQLARVAIINLDTSSALPESRPYVDIQLNVPFWVLSVTIKRLTSPQGATAMDSADITWGGLSWTYESNGNAYRNHDDTSSQRVIFGQVKIRVYSSEAVTVYMNRSPFPWGPWGSRNSNLE